MQDAESALLLVRIETKLDVALRQQEDHERRLRVLESHGTSDHDARIVGLEKWRYALPTAGFLSLASMATAVASVIWR